MILTSPDQWDSFVRLVRHDEQPIIGVRLGDGVHRLTSYNVCEDEPIPIPPGYDMEDVDAFRPFWCGPKELRRRPPTFAEEGMLHFVHYNGGISYYCVSTDDTVRVMEQPDNAFFLDEDWSSDPSENAWMFTHEVWRTERPQSLWIENAGIVVRTEDDRHVFIGSSVFSFEVLSPIVRFDPSSCAIDADGNAYILEEKVILMREAGFDQGDPCGWYYDNGRTVIGLEHSFIPPSVAGLYHDEHRVEGCTRDEFVSAMVDKGLMIEPLTWQPIHSPEYY